MISVCCEVCGAPHSASCSLAGETLFLCEGCRSASGAHTAIPPGMVEIPSSMYALHQQMLAAQYGNSPQQNALSLGGGWVNPYTRAAIEVNPHLSPSQRADLRERLLKNKPGEYVEVPLSPEQLARMVVK